MQLQLSGHNLEITQALHDVVNEKLSHLKASANQITNIHVILSVDKHEQCAEAQINLPKKTIFAEARNADMYNAIDELVAKLSRQLIKYKEMHLGHQE